jgi:aldose 1-epimerase
MTHLNTQEAPATIHIQSHDWHAQVAPQMGANLYRLQHRPSGLEVLRSPRSLAQLRQMPEHFGIPVLFPPNRIDGGQFIFEGREYLLPLNEPDRGNHVHGLILGKPWHVVEAGLDHVVMQHLLYASSGWPHDCTLTLRYMLDDDRLIQQMTVTNDSDTVMPMALGYHTALTMSPDSTAHATVGDQQWEIVAPRMLPSGRLVPLPQSEHWMTDQQVVSRHCPMVTGQHDGKPYRGAVITHPSLGVAVLYEVDALFRHWYLWNGRSEEGFFCAEPVTWMTNAPNLNLPEDVTGVQALGPAQSVTVGSTMRVVGL